MRQFVEKCLATVSLRLSAKELLNDPFLQMEDSEYDLRPVYYYGEELDNLGPLLRRPLLELQRTSSSFSNGYLNGYAFQDQNEWGYQPVELEASGIELFEHHDDEHCEEAGISIKGKRRDDGGIFLRLRISDKEGLVTYVFCEFLTFLFIRQINFSKCITISLQAAFETSISHSTLKTIQHSVLQLKWLRSWTSLIRMSPE